MSVNTDRKSKRLSLVEFPAIPHKFIVKPNQPLQNQNRKDQELKQPTRPENLQSKTYPVLTLRHRQLTNNSSGRWNFENIPNLKGTVTKGNNDPNIGHHGNRSRWNSDSIPNLKGITSDRRIQSKLRLLSSREDTFDADYMMPSQVREVLESEGLEHGVINRAIGKAEEKHKLIVRKMAEAQLNKDDKKREPAVEKQLPPIITTTTKSRPSAWLDLAKHDSHTSSFQPLWENPLQQTQQSSSEDYLNWKMNKEPRDIDDDIQLEIDKKKWQSAQHAELLFFGRDFNPPRIVLVSSKIPKVHLLTAVYRDDVIPVIYDFDTWTFADILDEVSRKLEMYRKNCKAKSIMVLCQGGPGYIYLLRNVVLTPQKLHKSSYKKVAGFWRSLAENVSKMYPEESALHIFGFNLLDNDQGRKLLPMLQSLMYPNMVRIEVLNDDTEEGKLQVDKYFKYARYKVWKIHQNTSVNDIDFAAEEKNVFPKKSGQKKLTLSIR